VRTWSGEGENSQGMVAFSCGPPVAEGQETTMRTRSFEHPPPTSDRNGGHARPLGQSSPGPEGRSTGRGERE
jgi:hypothetical protein